MSDAAGRYSKSSGAELPAGSSMTTSTTPAGCAGAIAVMVVSLITTTVGDGTPSNVTPVAPVKPVPVMVTSVPPDSEPSSGTSVVTIGASSL